MLLSAQDKYLREHRGDFLSSWRNAAACQGTDTEVFFSDASEDQETARHVCWTCPSASECRQWAIEAREKFGMWGGLTAGERHALSRKASSAA